MTWHKHDNLCWATGDDGKAKVVGIIDADGQLCQRRPHRRGEPDGPRVGHARTRVACSPHSRASVPARRRSTNPSASTCARPNTNTKPNRQAVAQTVRPDDADRSQRHARRHPAAAGRGREPDRRQPRRAPAVERLPGRRGGRFPQHRRRRHRPRALRAVGLDQRRRRCSTPTSPRASSTSHSPTGRRSWSARCTWLPTTVALDDVPDIGGALMQWHIHDNLCYTDYPEQPRVAGAHRRRTAPVARRSSSTIRRR